MLVSIEQWYTKFVSLPQYSERILCQGTASVVSGRGRAEARFRASLPLDRINSPIPALSGYGPQRVIAWRSRHWVILWSRYPQAN